MTYLQLRSLLLDTKDCATLDEYITECGGSVPAEYTDESGGASEAVELLTNLWQFRDGIRFRQLREFSEHRIAEFSRLYGIPTRTVEDWDKDRREPPAYVMELILTDVLNAKKAEE